MIKKWKQKMMIDENNECIKNRLRDMETGIRHYVVVIKINK